MKVCTKCEVEKPFEEFYKDKRAKDGLRARCKCCMKAEDKARYDANPAKKIAKTNEWKRKNREKHKEHQRKLREKNREKYAAYAREYYQKNKAKCNAATNRWAKKKRATDPVFKIKQTLRTMLCDRLRSKGYATGVKRCEILGCTTDELIVHLAMQFENGMSLANHGDWHIDHIVPMAWAKTEEEAIWLNHYSNLQPLWAEDNLKKWAN